MGVRSGEEEEGRESSTAEAEDTRKYFRITEVELDRELFAGAFFSVLNFRANWPLRNYARLNCSVASRDSYLRRDAM